MGFLFLFWCNFVMAMFNVGVFFLNGGVDSLCVAAFNAVVGVTCLVLSYRRV